MTALYIERYQNQEFTRVELQSDRPIIGIAQTGSDLTPCNKIHVFLMDRIKAGIRDGGGIPMALFILFWKREKTNSCIG